MRLVLRLGAGLALDDAFPDTDQERHDWSSRILQFAEGAGTELASHAGSFEQLRDLICAEFEAIEREGGSDAAAAQAFEAARRAKEFVRSGIEQAVAGRTPFAALWQGGLRA